MNQVDQQQLHASYTLHGKGEIMERLRLMERQKTLITAIPAGQASGFMTTILKVLPEKRVLAVDASANEQLNSSFRNAGSIVFTAQFNGVQARFTANSVTPAQLDGQAVFAVPIPESLYWLERRQFYRVPLPVALPVKCSVPVSEGKRIELPVLDVSLTGMALGDKQGRFDRATPLGSLYVNCTLDLPAFAGEKFALNLRNILSLPGAEGDTGHVRLGFAIEGGSREFEILLQKFLFDLELQIKRSNALVKD